MEKIPLLDRDVQSLIRAAVSKPDIAVTAYLKPYGNSFFQTSLHIIITIGQVDLLSFVRHLDSDETNEKGISFVSLKEPRVFTTREYDQVLLDGFNYITSPQSVHFTLDREEKLHVAIAGVNDRHRRTTLISVAKPAGKYIINRLEEILVFEWQRIVTEWKLYNT